MPQPFENNDDEFTSRSPIDQSVVWQGPASTPVEINATIMRAMTSQKSWAATSLETRIDVARRYADVLKEQRHEIESLLVREVGKLRLDAVSEVDAAIAKVENSILALEQRRSPVQTILADGSRQLRYRPLGVVIVLGPFNFPLHLPGAHIIPALLAGNAVVFKPSEQATAIGEWMTNAWHRAGLPKNVYQMISGGVDVAGVAVDSPHIGGVFLTGSRRAGLALRRRLVDRYDVLLAMELGGNNPIVIGEHVSPKIAANILTHSAFVSTGQRCTCARRAIIISGAQSKPQVDAIVTRTKALSVGKPDDAGATDLGPLISPHAADEVVRVYENLISQGCRSLLEPKRSATCASIVSPGIVDASEVSWQIFRDIGDREWFGPLLVIRRVEDFSAAILAANATCYGLAASLLGGDANMFERFANEVAAGIVNWNRGTTGAAATQPFGGLGQSGNHQPAGFFAIDSCSDPVASLAMHQLPTVDPWQVS